MVSPWPECLRNGRARNPYPRNGAPAAARSSPERLRGVRRSLRGPRGDALPGRAVGPRPVVAASGLSPWPLVARGLWLLGGGAQRDRRVRWSRRLLRAGGLARFGARLGFGPPLVGLRLRGGKRAGRVGARVRRVETGERDQPHL